MRYAKKFERHVLPTCGAPPIRINIGGLILDGCAAFFGL